MKKRTSPKENLHTEIGSSDETPIVQPRWTFLTNHTHVLCVLASEPGIVLRSVAQRVGITERAVQRIIQDLEEAGYIAREKVGRRNRYEVFLDKSLRHPIEEHRTIGELLELVARSNLV